MENMTWEFVLRLLMAGVFGTVIGLDREYRDKDAGFRTHFLVSMGSALIMIVSQYGFEEVLASGMNVRLDPSRVAAQVVSGIGFIGAGTIIFQRQIVRGLTTAASLWATAGIGLAAGAGMYGVATAATILTLVALEGLTLIFRVFETSRSPILRGFGARRILVVFTAPTRAIVNQALDCLKVSNYSILSYEVTAERDEEGMFFRTALVIRAQSAHDNNRYLDTLRQIKEITIERIA